jgi:hypothetical protein
MPSRIDDLLSRIAHLERELETEVSRARDRWRYQIEAGRVRFECGRAALTSHMMQMKSTAELAAYAVRHGLSD